MVTRYWDATLTLLHVLVPQPHAPGRHATDPLDWEIERKDAEEYLAGIAAEARRSGVRVETKVAEGQVAARIIHEARVQNANLLILSSHGGGGHLDWPVGSTAQAIACNAPTSLLIIPAELSGALSSPAGMSVMVGLDGSPRAECALPIASNIARSTGGTLVLLHVASPLELPFPGTLTAGDQQALERLQRRGKRMASEYLQRLQSRLTTEGTIVKAILRDDADVTQALVDAALQEDVGLIALSAHGATGRRSSPHGGIVAKCLLEQMPAPFIIVQDLSPDARAWLKANPGLHRAPERMSSLYREELER